MKKIKTAGNDIIVAEVPEDAIDYKISGTNYLCYYIEDNWEVEVPRLQDNWKILGKLSELSEEDCSKFVEQLSFMGKKSDKWLCYSTLACVKNTAKESLISLLQSNGIDTNNNLLLIEVL